MDREPWWAPLHGVAESDTTERLSTSAVLLLPLRSPFLHLSLAPLPLLNVSGHQIFTPSLNKPLLHDSLESYAWGPTNLSARP